MRSSLLSLKLISIISLLLVGCASDGNFKAPGGRVDAIELIKGGASEALASAAESGLGAYRYAIGPSPRRIPYAVEYSWSGAAITGNAVNDEDAPLGLTDNFSRLGCRVVLDKPLDFKFGENVEYLYLPERLRLNASVSRVWNGYDLSRIIVVGHADADENSDSRDSLAWSRAEHVSALLVMQGVDVKSIHVEVYGARKPVAAGRSLDEVARNRRVEVYFFRKRCDVENIDE